MYFDCAILKKEFSEKNSPERYFLGVLCEKTPFWGIFGPFFDDNSIMSHNQSARNCQKV
jgi:hypothetical protein